MIDEKLDKLPDKWYIKVTKENQELCNKWRGYNVHISINKYMYNELPGYYKRGVSKDEIIEGYSEISFDQFKKWVLKEETKFEVGKWYEIGNPKRTYINIVKIKNILSNTRIESEIGYYNIKGTENDQNCWVNGDGIWSDIDYYKKLSLEEIQQYLPENHPDKIKSVEEWSVGSWVVCIKDYFDPFIIGAVAQLENGTYGIDEWCVNLSNGIGKPCMPPKDNCKWFPTKQQAEEFAKTLLEPKQLTVNDLVEGEIYYCKYNSIKTLFQINQNKYLYGNKFGRYSWLYWIDSSSTDLRLATPEEKKWLNVCIKQDKFIPQDQLDKYDDEGNLIEIKKDIDSVIKSEKSVEFEFNRWYKSLKNVEVISERNIPKQLKVNNRFKVKIIQKRSI